MKIQEPKKTMITKCLSMIAILIILGLLSIISRYLAHNELYMMQLLVGIGTILCSIILIILIIKLYRFTKSNQISNPIMSENSFLIGSILFGISILFIIGSILITILQMIITVIKYIYYYI